MAYTVKAVADLAGVSVRTLHHYDEIGLLKPARISESGYRLYSDDELELLQQILFFRELGFGLQEIRRIVHSPGFNRRQALTEHRQSLLARQQRLERLIRSIDRTLDTMERGVEMDKKDMFDGFDPSQYEEEARERWGHTEAYKESMRRAKSYTKADWDVIGKESREIERGIAARMDRDPSDAEVQEFIRRHHQQINDRFYQCPIEVYRGLGEMYVVDPRFTAHYDDIKPGLAKFMQAAMSAYCDSMEGK